jgi:hypothetical protein
MILSIKYTSFGDVPKVSEAENNNRYKCEIQAIFLDKEYDKMNVHY